MMFRDGDVLLTYGKGGFWPPRRWVMWLLYRAIRKYQTEKWTRFRDRWEGVQRLDAGATHARVYLHGMWWEVTYPKAKWVTTGSLLLHKKKWKLVRWHQFERLDSATMVERAEAIVKSDNEYDVGDLFDTAISGILGKWKKHFRIFGDRAKKLFYCSTGAREVLIAGGATFWQVTVDPAYFANNPREWRVIRCSRR